MSAETVYALIQEYGYYLIFITLLAGIIGFPVPDEGILFFTGAMIARGQIRFFPAFIIGVLAVQSGSLLNYWIGARFWGKRAVAINGSGHGTADHYCKWQRAIRFLCKFGVWAVPFSSFVPGLWMGMAYGSGALQVPIRVYIVGSLAGSAVWVSLYLWLGFVAGSQF